MLMIKHKSGFTLVELTFVIGIITILSTLGLISYSSYLKRARTDQNRRLAEETSQRLEAWKLATGSKVDKLGVKQANSFYSSLSEDLKTRFADGELGMPSKAHKDALKLKVCTDLEDSSIINGYEIYFYNYEKDTAEKITTGNTSSDSICN